MTPTKVLVGQIVVSLLLVLTVVRAGTQVAASMLTYQPQLGLPWFVILGWPVYLPWRLFE